VKLKYTKFGYVNAHGFVLTQKWTKFHTRYAEFLLMIRIDEG